MAVSIDKVYQKVLAFANKEQRGYITPQEFNLFADQAQMEIFEQYFYDLNQFKRLPGNQGEYTDVVSIIKDKISPFEYWAVSDNITVRNKYGDIFIDNDIPNLYRLGEVSIIYDNGNTHIVCEQLTPREHALYEQSHLTKSTKARPSFVKYTNVYDRMKIFPYPRNQDGTEITSASNNTAKVRADYTRKPTKPNWGYVVVNNKPLYNSSRSMDFELHSSEEPELVYRILAFAGIAMQKPNLTQAVVALESNKVQQEKQ